MFQRLIKIAPERMHSVSPVPSTMQSYSASIFLVKFSGTNVSRCIVLMHDKKKLIDMQAHNKTNEGKSNYKTRACQALNRDEI